MMLSNQMMATLSKFTLKARKDIGVIKVADIINDRRYAYNSFVQAVFSNDVDLMSLALELVGNLKIEKNMILALKAYIDHLKVQAASENYIQSSKCYLLKLAQYVYGIKVDGVAYRQAINELLATVNNDEKKFCINLARGFYPYWINANSELIENSHGQVSDVDYKNKAFVYLWNSVDDEFLFTSEAWLLDQYTNAMANHYVPENEIENRAKVAKVILIEQRKYKKTVDSYRTNIDKIQSLFSSAEMREFFLVVSREFYSFWADSEPSIDVHRQLKSSDLEMPAIFA